MKQKKKIKRLIWVIPICIILGAGFGALVGARENAMNVWLFMGSLSGVLAGLAAFMAFRNV